MKIVIIGAGSVGTNLHHALESKGIRAELIHARPLTANPPTAEPIPQADVYIYAIADHALREVISKVYAPKALHLHTSGSMPIEVFGEDKPHAGVLYFFQSFSREVLIEDWSGIPCIIEGRNIDDIAAIYSLAQCLTSRIYEAGQHDRERLHIAGIFANNYSNLMYRIAAEVLKLPSAVMRSFFAVTVVRCLMYFFSESAISLKRMARSPISSLFLTTAR